MLNLGLAIICSALVSTIMRLGEGRIKNNMGMFISNYIVCALLSFSFTGGKALFSAGDGIGKALGMGVTSGILYLACFVLLQYNIRKNGVVMASTFMKLGVIIPTLMAVIIFGEAPKLLQIIGILLAIAAILIINLEKEDGAVAKYKLLLIILLFVSGITDSMANIYDKTGNANLKDEYLLITFAVAGICAFILWLKEKQGFCRWDIIFGICIGVPNYFSSRFLLGALSEIPAMVVYPVFSVLTIVVISAVSFVLFRERLSKKKLAATGVILISLVLLNI